jgi:hypothetical protein
MATIRYEGKNFHPMLWECFAQDAVAIDQRQIHRNLQYVKDPDFEELTS